MNDDDVLALLTEQRGTVSLTTPVEQVIRRGQSLRARRLVPGTAGMMALVAGVAVAAVNLTAGQNATNPRPLLTRSQLAHLPTVRLAAWTVAELANGNISVTIRQLRDPSQLQQVLRADGVPASVTFQRLNQSCQPFPQGSVGSPSQAVSPLLKQVFPEPYQHLGGHLRFPLRTPKLLPLTRASGPPTPLHGIPTATATVIVIDPTALPAGAGVQLASSSHAAEVLLPQLVRAQPECTGDNSH